MWWYRVTLLWYRVTLLWYRMTLWYSDTIVVVQWHCCCGTVTLLRYRVTLLLWYRVALLLWYRVALLWYKSDIVVV